MSKFKDYAGYTIEAFDLLQICPDADIQTCNRLAPLLEQNFYKFQVRKRTQISMFIAQIAHESGSFYYTREIGDAAYLRENYEGRDDLGNTEPGDGIRFCGRGYLQITGRSNYKSFQDYLATVGIRLDLVTNPAQVERDLNLALLSAFWFFNTNNLWGLAANKDIKAVTLRINGGLNGFSDRINLFNRACQVFSC